MKRFLIKIMKLTPACSRQAEIQKYIKYEREQYGAGAFDPDYSG
jgi:hypothetical protein